MMLYLECGQVPTIAPGELPATLIRQTDIENSQLESSRLGCGSQHCKFVSWANYIASLNLSLPSSVECRLVTKILAKQVGREA